MKKKAATFLQMLSDFFISYLPIVRGLSENTISSYKYAFQLLFEFLMETYNITPENVTFENLTSEIVVAYFNWLESSRKCSPKTRNQRRAAILSFAKYCTKKEWMQTMHFSSAILNIPKKKVPKANEMKYFTKEEIGALLKLPILSRAIGQRDLVLMSVLYATGARAQEICNLRINDVIFSQPTTVKLTGKGNKSRVVTVPENCACLLKKYFSLKKFTHSADYITTYVFSSQTHEKMSISCVEEIVKRYVEKARKKHPELFEQPSYSPHSFRHSIAVHMLESGVPLPVIQAFLGHATISSTMIYTTVTPELADKYLANRDTPSAPKINTPKKTVTEYLPFLCH